MIQFQENRPTYKEGQKVLFHRTLSATARVPTSTNALHWDLKVKYREYDVCLTKKLLFHSQNAKNQLDS